MIIFPYEIALLAAQVSSVIATILGIAIFAAAFVAFRKVSPGIFYNPILLSTVFTLIAVMGVTSMTMYHLTEHVAGSMHELAENLWYVFMFAALIISWFESFELVKFGKYFKELDTKLSFVKAKWNSKR